MKLYQIPSFKRSKNKTVCTLSVCLLMSTTDEKICFSTKGVSKRNPDDTYNRQIGDRLAESRASKKALKIVKKYLTALRNETTDLIKELDKSDVKLDRMIRTEDLHCDNLKSSADSKVFQ